MLRRMTERSLATLAVLLLDEPTDNLDIESSAGPASL